MIKYYMYIIHILRIKWGKLYIFFRAITLNQPNNLPPNAKLMDQLHAMKREIIVGVRI